MSGAGREAIVFTTCYVMQWGAKAGHTVGLVDHHAMPAATSSRFRLRPSASITSPTERPQRLRDLPHAQGQVHRFMQLMNSQ